MGTRKAIPVSLPFKAGRTFPTAYETQERKLNRAQSPDIPHHRRSRNKTEPDPKVVASYGQLQAVAPSIMLNYILEFDVQSHKHVSQVDL